MSMDALRWVRPIRCTPTQKLVLWALADRANDDGEAWPSITWLMEATCLSDRGVQKALAALRAAGIVHATVGCGRHRTTIYRLAMTQHAEAPADVGETVNEVRGSPTETPNVVRLTTAERANVVRGSEVETPNVVRETPNDVPETPNDVHPIPHDTKGTPTKEKKGVRGIEPPTWLPPEAWDDWCRYRQGKLWTAKAQELSVRKLDDLRAAGHDPVLVIEQSIANGWRGLFPLKGQVSPSKRESKLAWMLDPDAMARLDNVVGFAR